MFVLLHHTKKPEHHKIDVKLKILWPNCKIDITCNTESKKNKKYHHIMIILQGKRNDSCILIGDVFARYKLIHNEYRKGSLLCR